MQFVADVEGELNIDPVGIGVTDGGLDPIQPGSRGPFGEQVDHGHGKRPSSGGQGRLEGDGGEGHRQRFPASSLV